MDERKVSRTSTAIIVSIVSAAILIVFYILVIGECLVGGERAACVVLTENLVFALLSYAIFGLYLLGTGVIIFGSILITIRYVRVKLRSPYEPADIVLRAFYLTLGLEILIGAEIISTAVTRTLEGFVHLGATIAVRGLITLLIYFERKHSTHE